MTLNIIKDRYIFSAIPDKIKKELATVKCDIGKYKEEIE